MADPMPAPTICLVEIRFVPKRGKGEEVRDAIADALDRLTEERLSQLTVGAAIEGRYVKEV